MPPAARATAAMELRSSEHARARPWDGHVIPSIMIIVKRC